MEKEIVTAGRKLADYLKGEGVSKLGRKELHLLASVSTDLLPGDGLEMVRKMIFVGTRSGVYESLVLGSDPINLLVASAMDRLINREMIAEAFAKKVIALILVVMHPSDEEVAKIERFVDGVQNTTPTPQPITPVPTPQPQPIIPQPTPRPITPQPTPTPQPTIPQRVQNIPIPPVQPTIQQRIQNTPTPRPTPPRNNVTITNTNNTTVNNNTRIVTTNNGVVSITGGGGNITVNGVTVSGGGGNISINSNNNNTTVTVGGNITVNGGNITVSNGGTTTSNQLYDIRNGVLVKYNGTDSDVVIPKGVKVVG